MSYVMIITPAAYQRPRERAVAARKAVHMPPKADGRVLRRWYTEELQPRLSKMDPSDIVRGAAVRRSYAYYIVAGTRVPHPRHYPNLAALVGVELPRAFAVALSATKVVVRSAAETGHSSICAHAAAMRR